MAKRPRPEERLMAEIRAGTRSQDDVCKLDAFMDAACAVIPGRYAAPCCLGATRIAVDVLARLQIAARPLVVKIAVHNPALAAKGRPPQSSEESRLWRERDGAVMARCGGGTSARQGNWPGHLVAIALERFLIDLSLPQMNRPDRQIELARLLCPVSSEFLSGRAALSLLMNDCRVFYDALPDDQSYVGVGDWHLDRTHQPAIEEICQRLGLAAASGA
jgi:hypothetical protein